VKAEVAQEEPEQVRFAGWRRNLQVIWLATFSSMLGGHLAMPFMPLYIQRELGVSDPGEAAIWSGLAIGGTGIAMAIMAPIWGILSDRHGRKAMLVRAQFALAVSNTASGFAGAPWQLVAVRSIQGGFSGVVGASRALVAGSVPREQVPRAMSLIQAAIFMGQTLGPTVGGVIGSVLGFRAAFFATGIVNLLAGTLAMRYVREHRGPATESRPKKRDSVRDLLRSRPLAMLVLVQLLSSASMSCVRPILPLLLGEIDPRDDAAVTAGLAFAVLGIAGAVAALGSSRGISRARLRHLLVLSALAGALTSSLVSVAATPTIVIALLFGVGCAQGLLAPAVTALLSLHAPASRQGTAFGLMTSAQAVALSVGPLVGAAVASTIGLHAAFVASGVMLVSAAAFGVWVPPPPGVRDVEEL
jgi:MFS transporter, DHA1 family, multidrug resistance protein